MSRYPDDQYDDARRDDRDDRSSDRGGAANRARSIVSAPAIGLIVVGLFSFLSIALGVIQYPGLDAQFDQNIQEIENRPNQQQAAKQEQIDMMNKIREGTKVALPIAWVLVGIQGVITTIAGFKLKSLTGRGWVVTGSILSMIPCVSGCCFLGLIFGIWSLVALGKPDVKAAYAANRGGANPDDRYMQ